MREVRLVSSSLDCTTGLGRVGFGNAEERSRKIEPESVTATHLLAKLQECGRLKDLKKVVEVHSLACETGLVRNLYVANSLIDVYGDCGSMANACGVFNGMVERDVVTWNALLQGYAKNGKSELALEVFDRMSEACVPNARTYVAAVSACGAMAGKQVKQGKKINMRRWLVKGKIIHSAIISTCCCNIYVENTLIDMYGKCGSMAEARCVFDAMVMPDVVSWNALLQGYVENGESELALGMFWSLERDRRDQPNARTFIAALSACACLALEELKEGKSDQGRRKWLEVGKKIYSLAVARKCCSVFVEGVLVDMFSKCGSMADARSAFEGMSRRDVVSWTALMQGYVENGESEIALEIFDDARKFGCLPNSRSFAVALSACAALAAEGDAGGTSATTADGRWLEKGKRIHLQAVTSRCCNMFVESSLVDLYAKCGRMIEAREVFDAMKQRDVVCWNALVLGYVDNGEFEIALKLIGEMNVLRNSLTYVAALMACTSLMAVERGKAFHAEIGGLGLQKDVVLANCLVDFYGKCGDMDLAKQVFDGISRRTIVSWTALMCGYSLQGDTDQVLELFDTMREVDKDLPPNEVTFVCILTACSHGGLTDKGKEYFNAMQTKFGVAPTIRHYACLVDLFGRGNNLDEALKVVKEMPFEADVVTWKTILGACHKWGNLRVGKVAYESLMKLNEGDASAYVLMASIYRDAGFSKDGVGYRQKSTTMWTDEFGIVHRFSPN